MDPSALDVFIAVNSSPDSRFDHHQPIAPQKVVARTYLPQSSQPFDPHELDNVQWNSKTRAPSNSGIRTPPGAQTPRIPIDVEMSRLPSPLVEDMNEFESMQSFSSPPMNRFRLFSACLLNFGSGMNDSAPGALIPYMERYTFLFMNSLG